MAKNQKKTSKKTENQSKNTTFVVFDKQIEGSPITKASSRGWINWGKKNDTPAKILDMYNNSPTLDACITFCVSSLIGRGLKLDGIQSTPNYKYTWDELIRRLALDYFLYGAYAFQVIKNRDNSTYSFYHTPMEKVRCGERDSDGVINSYYLSADWSAINKPGNEPVEIPSFIMRPDNEYKLKIAQPYLYVYETYSPTMDYYSLPCWWSAMKAVRSEVAYLQNDFAQAESCFLSSGVMSLPPADSEEEKESIVQQIRDTFIGPSNSARLMVVFRNSSEDQPVEFTKFSHGDGEFDIFAASNERAITRILSSFNINSRMLIGVPENNTGFNSEGALLQTAYETYQLVAGRFYRAVIIDTINALFKMNGFDIELEVNDVSFDNSNNATVNNNSEENVIEEQS